jgi:hypothetical protein
MRALLGALTRRFSPVLPWSPLALLLISTLVTVLTQAHRYGVTVDEIYQQTYGEAVLAWYRSRGQDTSFLTVAAPNLYMPQHGGIVDVIIASIQFRLPGVDPWLVRHILTGLIGWLGIVAIALCGYELGGPWIAFVAGLALWLYPRYEGAIYNNPKDIPAAVAMTFVLWATMQLPKYWTSRRRTIEVAVLIGAFLGMATAIRVSSIIWFGLLALIVAGWWAIHGAAAWRARRVWRELAWQGAVAGTIAATWFVVMVALWPYVFLNPARNLWDSIQVMSHFPWPGTELFGGTIYPATRLPSTYPLTWLVIGSPPATLLLALAGLVIALVEMARARRVNPAQAMVILAFALPLVALLVLHPTLYDTLRQFLFLIPPLILLAAYGLVRGARLLLGQRRPAARWLAAALLVAAVVSNAIVVADMVALSPYEYTYFSPLVGGLPGAAKSYETDYYGTCATAAAEWLNQNYKRYDSSAAPTVDSSSLLQAQIAIYSTAAIHERSSDPDFFIGFTRFGDSKRYSDYRVIHTVGAEGVTFCVVKVNPALVAGT